MKPFRILAVLSAAVLFCCPLRAAESASAKKSPPKNLLESILSLPVETTQGVTSAVEKSIFNLGEIRVSGSRISSERSEEEATDIPHNVTVVNEGEIELSDESVPEILSRHEGVTLSDELGRGLNARLDLRGFGGESKQALVLVDGVRAVEPFDNSVTWNLYPAEYLRQVEVTRGGTTMLGEGAFSGAVQLRTKGPTEKLRFSTQHAFGDFRTLMDFADVSGTFMDVGFYVGARYMATDGYRQNGDHSSVSSLSKVRKSFSDVLSVENSFYVAGNETGIPGPLTATEVSRDRRQKDPDGQFGDQFADKIVVDAVGSTLYLEGAGIELSNLASFRLRNQDSIQSFGGFFGGTSINEIKTVTYSDVIQASRRLEGESYDSEFTGGVEWSADDIYNPFSFVSFSFGPFDSERSLDRRSMGYFLHNRTTVRENWTFEAGARYDNIHWAIYDLVTPSLEKHKKADNFSQQFGVQYRIFEPLSVYASNAETFKVPDANALIFETPNLFTPNPAVDPSIARHNEVGVRYAHPVFGSVRADYFYIETKKEILFNTFSTRNENFDTIRDGFELANEIAVTKQVDVFASWTYLNAEFDNGQFDGKDVPLTPRSRWTLGTVVRPDAHWTILVQAAGVNDQYALNDFRNAFEVEDYWTLGGKVSYRRGPWEIYVRGENMTGEEYSSFVTSNALGDLNFNPAPAEYFEAGFKMEI